MTTVTVPQFPGETTNELWWRRLALIGGVVSIALGLILMIWPRETLVVVGGLLGLWLILAGAVRLAQAAFIPEGRGLGTRVLEAVVGLLFIVLGALTMRHLSNSLTLLAVLIGVAWLAGGIAWIFGASSAYQYGWSRSGALLLGAISILGALIILIWPQPTLIVIAWFAGIWFVIIGVAQLIAGWRAGRAEA